MKPSALILQRFPIELKERLVKKIDESAYLKNFEKNHTFIL